MAISGSQKAYTWARSGLGRSGATRSNYVTAWSSIYLVNRDEDGIITSAVDITDAIRFGSLSISQALNDEPDTCSFQIVPTAPAAAVPHIGQEIHVAWTPGDVLFQGYAVVVQFDRRVMNESPWVSVQCQDFMWRFDARIVTYRFPSQSVSQSIVFLIQWFVNDPEYPGPNDFSLAYVDPNMPALPAFDVVNQRPSTVLRRLMAAVQGGFYIQGREVHAWAGTMSEPNQPNPMPLTNDLPTLKSFRVTHDATQLRKRVLVEGRRTSTLIPYPAMPDATKSTFLGLPLTDAALFTPATGPDARYVARIGTQWMFTNDPIVVTPLGANPPQARVSAAFTPGDVSLGLEMMTVSPPPRGWIRIAGQYSRYAAIVGNPLTGPFTLTLPAASFPYGVLTAPIPAGEMVEWVEAVMAFEPHGLSWTHGTGFTSLGDSAIRAHPADTPVVTLAEADAPLDGWPPIESFVQDGRYSYAGALDRAQDDLAAFSEPLISATWETDDPNARPGRVQQINLTGSSVMDPLNLTLTILSVQLSFPLRTLPPRRVCAGGTIKPSTFLELALTDES